MLTAGDLDDPGRFFRVSKVPILDAHDDPEKGRVDERLLHLLARTSNARVSAGDPAAVILGHTKRKQSLVIIRPDGSQVVLPGSDELDQPPILGYSRNFTVEPFRGRPCLHADFFIHNEHADHARSLPYRSVERLEPRDGDNDISGHVVKRIALLRTPPERDLGSLTIHKYEQSGTEHKGSSRVLRVRYERALGKVSVTSCLSPGQRRPAPGQSNPHRSATPMSTAANVRRIIYEQLGELETLDSQLRAAEALRNEGYTLDDAEIERLAALDPHAFDGEMHRVRKTYSRRSLSGFEKAFGRSDETTSLQAALEYSTRNACTLDEAKAAIASKH